MDDKMKRNFGWVIAFFIGITLGAWIGGSSNSDKVTLVTTDTTENLNQTWTCAMHPQIRQNEPGKCPICGMFLTPLEKSSDNVLNIEMSAEAVSLSNIQTTKVRLSKPQKEILMQGKAKIDERKTAIISSRFAGRIEKLFVDFTGVNVKKGQKLASIYSPELISAQKELLEAIKFKDDNPLLYNVARNKLKLWNISDEQIDEIVAGGSPKNEIDVFSPLSGVVSKKTAILGSYVTEGDQLFEIIDLSSIWIVFDAYESDLPWIKTGDNIMFNISALPGKTFKSKVKFIDPLINPSTRTAAVRIDFDNSNLQIKPEMFAKGRLIASIPINKPKIIIPKSAVMWTGTRSVVYTKVPNVDNPTFEFREVVIGLDLGTHYIIEEGLEEGEEVVVNGAFKVDAAAQLSGKKSMMNK